MTSKDLGQLEGKTVLLSKNYYNGEESDRRFVCESGFGCTPGLHGQAIFGYFEKSGRKERVERYQVQKVVK